MQVAFLYYFLWVSVNIPDFNFLYYGTVASTVNAGNCATKPSEQDSANRLQWPFCTKEK